MKAEYQIRERISKMELVLIRYHWASPRTDLVRDDEARTRHEIELLQWVLDDQRVERKAA
jgi:hypothetical protein